MWTILYIGMALFLETCPNKAIFCILYCTISLAQSEESLGDLFLSDETGTFYTLSLRKVLTYTSEGRTYTDIHVVNGMNGTIIANVYVPTNMATTMITYDSGGEWSLIPSSSSVCYLPDCSLNFLLSLTAIVNALETTLFSK